MSDELHRKYRPRRFADVVGQEEAVATLRGLFKREGNFPHAVLFAGPTGAGKNTMAYICRDRLRCGERVRDGQANPDFHEVDFASADGVLEKVREIQSRMRLSSTSGPCRIWLLNEVQALSRAQFAQQALLDMLENPPPHVYFFLCTTDGSKLIPTIHSRCTLIKIKPVAPSVLEQLVLTVAGREQVEVSAECAQRIAEVADGSARKALVLLHQVLGLPPAERLEVIQKSDLRRQVFDLAKALLWEKSEFGKIAAILKQLEGEEAEGIRRMVLACARTELLKCGKRKEWAAWILDCFDRNFYDSGDAGLARACWEVFAKN